MSYEEAVKDKVEYIASKFAENPGHFAATILQMYWDMEKERDLLNNKLDQAYEDGYQMEGKYRDMKTQRDTLIDDIAVLRANNERLERENEQYIKLLKEFNNLINYKLAIHPGSDVYMYYRSELNKLGVK